MAKLSNDDSRFAAVVVDGAGVEFHLVNTAGSNYRYAVKRASDGAIVYSIPGDKHAGGGLALRSDGTIIVSIAALDPSTGKYPIYNYAVPGVATPPVSGGGGGTIPPPTTNVDQVARDMATNAQNTANQAKSTADKAQQTADSAKTTANSANSEAARAHQRIDGIPIWTGPDVDWQQARNATYADLMDPTSGTYGAVLAIVNAQIDARLAGRPTLPNPDQSALPGFDDADGDP